MLSRPRPPVQPSNSGAGGFRRDIQGLRAVAVGLVVLYHLFPGLLRGGFVGVDVFFVISGYLITGHMVREIDVRGRIDLLGFYARRARRLVPAATVVLAATWLAALVVLPSSRLGATAKQVVASALYGQNWLLAQNSVDYLTAEDAPSPVQHYWSLSVEEQFYLGWPLLLILAGVLAGAVRWSWQRAAVVVGASLCGLSLAASIWMTQTDGPAAYFATQARVWELGAGALLAILGARGELPRRFALPARWIGLGLIVASAVVFSAATAFPGYAALLPVTGSALALAAGRATVGGGLLGSRPMTWVGDHSYALYLVHWPVIVLWQNWSGGDIGALDGPAILGASLVLAWLITRFVEDPVRRSRAVASRARGLAVALVAAIPVAMVLPSLFPSATPVAASGEHPGAAVVAGDARAVEASIDTMVPRPETAADDRPNYYERGCEVGTAEPGTVACEFGEPRGTGLTVALVGDSQIGQWLPALESIAQERGWHIVTYLRSRCPWTATPTVVGAGDDSPYTHCAAWGRDVLQRLLADPPDVVLTSDRPTVGTPDHPDADADSHAAIAEGMTTYWRQIIAAGSRVVPIRETPEMGVDIPDCISALGASISDCDRALGKAIKDHGPVVLATGAMDGEAPMVDMTDLICPEDTCPPVIGNVLMYRDKHHLTRTYVLTLKPYLDERLQALGVGSD